MSKIKRLISGLMTLVLATANITMVFANTNEITQMTQTPQKIESTGTTQITRQTLNTQDKKYMKVNTSSLNVRSGPSTSSKKLGSLSRGTKVQIIQKSGIWYKISYKNSYGWCSGDYLVSDNSSSNNNNNNNTQEKKYMKVNTSSLKVRSSPSTSSKKLGSLSRGTKVQVIEKSGIWYKISYKNSYGWCSGDYLVSDNSSSNNNNESNKKLTKGHYIVIKTSNNTMGYYKDGKLVSQHRVATGKKSTPTPKGKFKIVNKIVNRPYYKDHIPGGDPRNPLGKRWLGLQVGLSYGSVYAIHGNNNENSIGTSVSGGCIRMHNKEVEWLFNKVPIGTQVIISGSSQTFKQIATTYKVILE
ncbi:MAG: SH3 domain-containing protein [Terrisporobacter sp.]